MSVEKLQCSSFVEQPLFEALGMGFCAVDDALVVRKWNGVLAQWGIAPEEYLGRRLKGVLTRICRERAGADRILDAASRSLAGETVVLGGEIALEFPSPVAERLHLVAAPVDIGGFPHAGLFFLPCGDAAQVRARYERILESATDGIMVIDPDRRVRIFNRACGELLGRAPEDVIRTNCVCGEVVNCHMEDGTSLAAQLCPARELFSGNGGHQVEEMLATNAAGEERWIETHYSAIRDDNGNVEFVVGIMRDVHDRKLLEQRLAQSEKLAALGQLTAGIAHEIKNPLGVILSSVEIILDEQRPKEMHREAAHFIKEEVQRLDHRLRAFLAFARPTPAHPEPVVLNSVIRRIAKGFEATWPAMTFELDLAAAESIVQLDADHFGRMLTNLLLNAVQALPGTGTIRIRTRADDGGVRVAVEDNGPGVPEALRRQILDPFFTTKADGTGLGLAIVCQLAASNGASLRVCASDLGGARFVLTFPHQSRRQGGP